MLRHGKHALAPWSYSTRTRAGKGKAEEHFTSPVHSDIHSALQCCLGCFCTGDVSLRVTSPDVLQTHRNWWDSWLRVLIFLVTFRLLSNTGQETVLSVPAATSQTTGSAVPWYTYSSFPTQLHTKPATSEGNSLTKQLLCCPYYHFMFSSLNLLFISKRHGMHFDIMYGPIISNQMSIHVVSC